MEFELSSWAVTVTQWTVVIGGAVAIGKFFQPQLRKFFGVTAVPADVLQKVAELLIEVQAIKRAVLPPSDAQVQEAILTLQRAGAFEQSDDDDDEDD